MNRTDLITSLRNYQTPYPEEKLFIQPFLELLQHSRAYFRDHLPGHVTGSAWIMDKTLHHVLLVHHAKLNRWLQPGGHADGEENIVAVALKEAEEETGLRRFSSTGSGIFDIDIHPIPARADFPEHLHYDVRVFLIANHEDEIFISAESHDVKWVALKELDYVTHGNESILRMAAKARQLFAADQK